MSLRVNPPSLGFARRDQISLTDLAGIIYIGLSGVAPTNASLLLCMRCTRSHKDTIYGRGPYHDLNKIAISWARH